MSQEETREASKVDDKWITRQAVPKQNYVSTEYFLALTAQGAREQLLISLAHQIPAWRIFEDVHQRRINSTQAAEILYRQRQSIYPSVRIMKAIWEFLKSFV